MFKKTTKLAEWLESRDWFVKNDIDTITRQYEDAIEKARIKAIANMLRQLKGLRESAQYEMANGDKTKYRQQATTEFNKITAEMKRLEDTIPYLKSPLSTEWWTL